MTKYLLLATSFLCGISLTAFSQDIIVKDVKGPSAMSQCNLHDLLYAKPTLSGPSKVKQATGSNGEIVNYEDRITNMPQYLHDFIDQYAEAGRVVLNGGSNWLSDPTLGTLGSNGYYYPLTEVTGSVPFSFPSGSSETVISQAATEAFNSACNAEYDILLSFMPYAFLAANLDYPEIFWIGNTCNYGYSSSCSYRYSTSGGKGTVNYTINFMLYLLTNNFDIRNIGISTYNFRNTTNLANGVQTFNNSIQTILSECQTGSRYDKLLAAHDWLTHHNRYNPYYPTYSQSQIGDTPWSAFSAMEGNNGQQAPVCEGYSRAFKVLCDKMGIPCILMSGVAKIGGNEGGHMWNYVQMENGKWYAIDVTWDDPAMEGNYNLVSGYECQDWFLVGSTTDVKGLPFIESHPEQWQDGHTSEGSYSWDLQQGPELTSLAWTPDANNDYAVISFDTDGGSPIENITQHYGTTITPPENPTREGYTFIGWEPAIPETMPANDMTCVAKWQINSYTLTYKVDGEEYKTDILVFGTEIVPEEAPTKEDYTFSGWSEIPETMPDHDVIITGSFIFSPAEYILADETDYLFDSDVEVGKLHYSRFFKDTYWQTWYVPFDLTLTNEALEHFAFAKFAGTYTDEDGSFYITLIRLKEGDLLRANAPYCIQARTADSTNPQVITQPNATLKAAVENSFFVLSMEKKITFWGNYTSRTVDTEGQDIYVMSEGKYVRIQPDNTLASFRCFFTIEDREDNPYASTPNPSEVKLMVLGEDLDPDGIEEIKNESLTPALSKGEGVWYSLDGKKHDKPQNGINIIRMSDGTIRKVLMK